jgi:hypothetical protein
VTATWICLKLGAGVSREEESQLVLEYQAKWREESLSWAEFEKAITRECEQVLDIADAALATSKNLVALRLPDLSTVTEP